MGQQTKTPDHKGNPVLLMLRCQPDMKLSGHEESVICKNDTAPYLPRCQWWRRPLGVPKRVKYIEIWIYLIPHESEIPRWNKVNVVSPTSRSPMHGLVSNWSVTSQPDMRPDQTESGHENLSRLMRGLLENELKASLFLPEAQSSKLRNSHPDLQYSAWNLQSSMQWYTEVLHRGVAVPCPIERQ